MARAPRFESGIWHPSEHDTSASAAGGRQSQFPYVDRVWERRSVVLSPPGDYEGMLAEIAQFFDERQIDPGTNPFRARKSYQRNDIDDVLHLGHPSDERNEDERQAQEPRSPLIDEFYFTVEGDWLTADIGDGFVRFDISTDAEVDTLYRYLRYLYRIGIPMVLLGKQPKKYPLFLDLDIWEVVCDGGGSEDVESGGRDGGSCGRWTREREDQLFRAIGEVVGLDDQLVPPAARGAWAVDCMVFSSHGISEVEAGSGRREGEAGETTTWRKISYHLVFPQIIVDRPTNCLPVRSGRRPIVFKRSLHRAIQYRIKDILLYEDETDPDGEVAELGRFLRETLMGGRARRIAEDHVALENDWGEVIDDNPMWHEAFPSGTGMRLAWTCKRPDNDHARAGGEDGDDNENRWVQNDFRSNRNVQRVKLPYCRFKIGEGGLIRNSREDCGLDFKLDSSPLPLWERLGNVRDERNVCVDEADGRRVELPCSDAAGEVDGRGAFEAATLAELETRGAGRLPGPRSILVRRREGMVPSLDGSQNEDGFCGDCRISCRDPDALSRQRDFYDNEFYRRWHF
eukprot:g7661.t1